VDAESGDHLEIRQSCNRVICELTRGVLFTQLQKLPDYQIGAQRMTEAELKKHLDAAEKSPKQIAAAVSGLPEKTLRYKPSPDKWCILEILGHLADIEILYAYRMRQMVADKRPVLAVIDQDDWARNLGYMEETP